jgi:hypothetical protein
MSEHLSKKMQDELNTVILLSKLRQDGWLVAVHNDYRLRDELRTFWLFAKGNTCVKGEGRTDEEALREVWKEIHNLGK